MRHKIPPDAFEHYRDLGPGRTYRAVAAKYGVSLRGVTKRALRENWQGRLAKIEADARHASDERAADDLHAVDDRHLRVCRAIQARALDALRSMPLNSGMAAVRALDISIKIERGILGRDTEDSRSGWALLVEAAAAVPPERVAEGLAAARASRSAASGDRPAVEASLTKPDLARLPVPLRDGVPLRQLPGEN